ncbi:hypothetical protein CG736_03155 [Kitasatospora sp. CB02891]|nr:hypothetical protein CG736_03155 [Kitasatospora sp. CB02891]
MLFEAAGRPGRQVEQHDGITDPQHRLAVELAPQHEQLTLAADLGAGPGGGPDGGMVLADRPLHLAVAGRVGEVSAPTGDGGTARGANLGEHGRVLVQGSRRIRISGDPGTARDTAAAKHRDASSGNLGSEGRKRTSDSAGLDGTQNAATGH